MLNKEEIAKDIEKARIKNIDKRMIEIDQDPKKIYPLKDTTGEIIKNEIGEIAFPDKQSLIDECKRFWESPDGKAAIRRSRNNMNVIDCIRDIKKKDDNKKGAG